MLDKELSKYDSDLVNDENIINITDSISFSTLMILEEIQDPFTLEIISRFMYLDINNYRNDFSADEQTRCKSYAVVRANPINQTNYRVIIGRNVSDILDLTKKIINFYFTAYSTNTAKTNRSQLNDIYNKLYN